MPLLALAGLEVLNFLLVGTSESQYASSAYPSSLHSPCWCPSCLPSTTLYSPSFLGYLPSPSLSLELFLPCCYIKAIWTFLQCDYAIHFFAFPHWPKEGTCLFSRAYGSQSYLMPVIYLHRVVLRPMICCHCSHSFHPLIILCSF